MYNIYMLIQAMHLTIKNLEVSKFFSMFTFDSIFVKQM